MAASVEEIVESIVNMNQLQIKQLKEALESRLGVTAASFAPVAAPSAAAGAAPSGPPVEEQTEFDVILKEIGPNKINVIKAVREVTSLGLKEAKDLVEAAPKPIKEAVAKDEAQALKEKLEATGAVVEVK